MCQGCVDAGDMTQEELDKRIKAGDESVRPIDERLKDGTITPEEAGDLADVLALIFGAQQDQDAHDRAKVDTVVESIMEILDEHAPTGALSPGQMIDATQDLAGKFMFKVAPASVAIALAVFSLRYRDLLEEWAANIVTQMPWEDAAALEGLTPEQVSAVRTAGAVRQQGMDQAAATQDLSERLN